MRQTRRRVLGSLLAAGSLASGQQDIPEPGVPRRRPNEPDEDARLPNGKSQNDAIAKKQHEDALKDAQQLVTLAEQIRDELQKAGNFVVPVTTLKKTEDVEKLAKKIRGRLKS